MRPPPLELGKEGERSVGSEHISRSALFIYLFLKKQSMENWQDSKWKCPLVRSEFAGREGISETWGFQN